MDELTYCDEGLSGILCMDQQLGRKNLDLIVLNSDNKYAINLLSVMKVHEQEGYCEQCTIDLINEVMRQEELNVLTRDDGLASH